MVPLATLLEPANSWIFYFELLEFISDDAISGNESVDTLTCVFGRPIGQAYAIGNPSVCLSVCLSVCNVGVLWPNGLSNRDDFWHTPCPGQQ